MPFTPAHSAAALPFLRTRLVPSALIVGAMAPDFEYFLRLAPGGGFGHTIAGAFLLSLPLAMAVLWLFHALVKEPLVRLFPDALRLRIVSGAFRFGGSGRFILIVLSLLIGIATHILWDSLTHSTMWPAHHFPWLTQRQYVPFVGRWIEHCALLQQVSSILGVVLLCAWLVRWYRNTAPIHTAANVPVPAARRWLVLGCIVAVACAGTLFRAVLVLLTPGLRHPWATLIGDSVTTLIALAWWALVLYALMSTRKWLQLEA